MIVLDELPPPPPINSQFVYPTLDRQTRADGVRHYVTPEGQALPSVTTILSGTKDMKGLDDWRSWVGESKADRIRDEAAALGGLMHEHLECHLEQRERPKGSNLIRQMARRMADIIIRRGLSRVDEVWGVEAPLYFPGLYAGTSDLIGLHEGEPAIIDFKNARKMRTIDMIGDYASQGAAYALAHNVLFDTNIKKIVVFMVARDLSYETFTWEGDAFNRACDDFQARIYQYEAKMVEA